MEYLFAIIFLLLFRFKLNKVGLVIVLMSGFPPGTSVVSEETSLAAVLPKVARSYLGLIKLVMSTEY